MLDPITPLTSTRRANGGPEIYAVVAEWANQGPILMESEGVATSYEAAIERCKKISGSPGILRVAVVRLTFENGNELILHDMERMQK